MSNIPKNIPFSQIVDVAREFMKPEEIDHHETDLYLKMNAVSSEIVGNISREIPVVIKTFISNIPPKVAWYEIWWAYHE